MYTFSDTYTSTSPLNLDVMQSHYYRQIHRQVERQVERQSDGEVIGSLPRQFEVSHCDPNLICCFSLHANVHIRIVSVPNLK